jgi:hypothetical protein
VVFPETLLLMGRQVLFLGGVAAGSPDESEGVLEEWQVEAEVSVEAVTDVLVVVVPGDLGATRQDVKVDAHG